MIRIKESDQKNYSKIKEKLNEYKKIYKSSDLKGKQNLKKEIYSLNIAESQKDSLWQQIVRAG